MSGRVVVVGAGIIGLLTARDLRRRGFEVVLIDRAEPGAGCSAGNTGWVCPSISRPVPSPSVRRQGPRWLLRADSPLYINPRAALGMIPWLLRFWHACSREAYERGSRALLELAADAPDRYRQLATDGVAFEWHEDGLLVLFETRTGLDDERRAFEEHGYEPVELVAGDDIALLEPDLAELSARFYGGLHVLPEGHVRPESACRAVAASCADLGVDVVTGVTATGFALTPGSGPKAASALRLKDAAGADRELAADAFVIAAGAASGIPAAACGTRLPLQAGKGYSITVRRPRIRLRHPLELADARVGISPFDDGLRVAGTMELSGINLRIDRRRLANVRHSAERSLPGILDGDQPRDWVGMRPLTPDGLPLIGRLPGTDNVWVNTGHQMLGITLAPVSAAALGSLIAGGEPPACFDAGAFDPGRF